MRQAFLYRLYVNKTQSDKLDNLLRLARQLYNAALQQRRDAWKYQHKSLNYYDQANQLMKCVMKFLSSLNLISVRLRICSGDWTRVSKRFSAVLNLVIRLASQGSKVVTDLIRLPSLLMATVSRLRVVVSTFRMSDCSRLKYTEFWKVKSTQSQLNGNAESGT